MLFTILFWAGNNDFIFYNDSNVARHVPY
uniref:Uncharacterized protein n=1 Tax=Anguilla anguilla TaxID=7936 RepID=A0A0E9R121_ANGAN